MDTLLMDLIRLWLPALPGCLGLLALLLALGVATLWCVGIGVALRSLREAGLALIVGAATAAWVGSLLAIIGLFRPLVCLALLVVVGIAGVLRRRRVVERSAVAAPRRLPWYAHAATLAGFLVLVALSARPAQTYIVTDDAGVYTLGSLTLAREGGLAHQGAELYPLSSDAVALEAIRPGMSYFEYLQDYDRQFLTAENLGLPIATRFWGPFFQSSLRSTLVEIGYLPAPKVFGALAAWLLGAGGVAWAGPLTALLGVFMLHCLLDDEMGHWVSLAVLALLAVSLTQVWFARFLLSEPFVQLFVFGGLWLHAVAQRLTSARDRLKLQLLGGACLALLPLVRFEGLLLAVILVGGLWLGEQGADQGRLGERWLGPTVVLLLGAQALAAMSSPYYVFSRAVFFFGTPQYALGAAALALLAAALVVTLLHGQQAQRWLERWAPTAQRLASMLMVAVALGVLLFGVVSLADGRPGQSVFDWAGQYCTRPLTLLGLAGMALCLWRLGREQWRTKTLLACGILLMGLYALDPMITAAHPWAMRRMMPLVLPALFIGASGPLAACVHQGLWRQRMGLRAAAGLASLALVGLLLAYGAVGMALRTWPFVAHREQVGVWEQLEELNGLLEPDAVLLMSDSERTKQLAQVMELAFGHPTFVAQDTEVVASDSPVMRRLIEAAFSQGRPVYYVVTGAGSAFRPAGLTFAHVGAYDIRYETLNRPVGRLPDAGDIMTMSHLVDIYRLAPASAVETLPSGYSDIALGAGSYPYVLGGLYDTEYDPQHGHFGWTARRVEIKLPWPAAEPTLTEAVALCLDVNAWRPEGAAAPILRLQVEGQRLETGLLPAGGEPGAVCVPLGPLQNDADPALNIVLETDVFRPCDYGFGADCRSLGVKLYGLRTVPASEAH